MTPRPTKYPERVADRIEFCRMRLRVLKSWPGQWYFAVYAEIERLNSEIERLTTCPN